MMRLELMILVVSCYSCSSTYHFMAATSFRNTYFSATNPRCTELIMIWIIGTAAVFVHPKKFVLLPQIFILTLQFSHLFFKLLDLVLFD